MVPPVCTAQNLARAKQIVNSVKKAVESYYGVELNFTFGSMLEVVRACMCAESLAQDSEFLALGTNDLTQATFPFSREDPQSKFQPLHHDVLSSDPDGTGNHKSCASRNPI